MKKLLSIISISLCLVTFSQNKLSVRKMKKIEKHASKLTGEWKYLSSYRDGEKFKDSSDYIYTDFKHLDSKNYFSLHKIIFEFEKNGNGTYKEVFKDNKNNAMKLPHQSQRKIIHRKGKYILRMAEMLDQHYVFFKIKKNILVLKRENQKIEKRYKRI